MVVVWGRSQGTQRKPTKISSTPPNFTEMSVPVVGPLEKIVECVKRQQKSGRAQQKYRRVSCTNPDVATSQSVGRGPGNHGGPKEHKKHNDPNYVLWFLESLLSWVQNQNVRSLFFGALDQPRGDNHALEPFRIVVRLHT